MKQGKKARLHTVRHLMDICQLENSESEPQFQEYKGRVVRRGDIVKNDSGSYAVFTEQGSSASQMTAAKSDGWPGTKLIKNQTEINGMVADIEELEEMDASELHARRLNA